MGPVVWKRLGISKPALLRLYKHPCCIPTRNFRLHSISVALNRLRICLADDDEEEEKTDPLMGKQVSIKELLFLFISITFFGFMEG